MCYYGIFKGAGIPPEMVDSSLKSLKRLSAFHIRHKFSCLLSYNVLIQTMQNVNLIVISYQKLYTDHKNNI